MTKISREIEGRMRLLRNKAEAAHLMSFFKTESGEYGEGDCFLGVRVPATRAIVKEYHKTADVGDVHKLVDSPWHEVRLAGFLLLTEIYNRAKKLRNGSERHIVDEYLSMLDRGNNWDLVDLVAYKILGDYLMVHPEEQHILDELASMDGHLWHQRVAIVSNLTIIRGGEYDSTFRIVKKMLSHPHDLIHKASGWMLREAGKRGGLNQLIDFLNQYATQMPRTMLRYAIEKFPEPQRKHFLNLR